MAIEYKNVDTSTLRGLKEAERLHRAGWKTASVGLFRVRFYRKRPARRVNPKNA